MKSRMRERHPEKERERDLASDGSFPERPILTEFDWSKATEKELPRGLSCEYRSPRTWHILCCLPRPLIWSWIKRGTAATGMGT